MKTMTIWMLAGLMMTGAGAFAQDRNPERESRSSRSGQERRESGRNKESKEDSFRQSRSDEDKNSRSNDRVKQDERKERGLSITTRSERTEERDGDRTRTRVDGRVEIQGQGNRKHGSFRIATETTKHGMVLNRETVSAHDHRYHEARQSCPYCSGRGFTLHADGFRHLRCDHCEGIGFRIYRTMSLDICPTCWTPMHGYNMDIDLRDLAWLETDRLDAAIGLSERQRIRIFEINLRYLERRYRHQAYSTHRRDREIRKVLNVFQAVAFVAYLNEMLDGELCIRCSERDY